jgi:glycosyltransferase involved in cell wall biosynthesis
MNNKSNTGKPVQRIYRILHCIDNLGRGGAESQMVQTLLNIDKSRFKNYVCYLHPPGDLEAIIVQTGLPVTNLDLPSSRSWFKAIRGLQRLVRQDHIELIHASTSYSNIYAPIVGVLEHIPVLFTLTTTHDAKMHSQTRSSLFRRLRVKSFFLLRSFILNITKTRIIAVSNAVKESAIEHLGIPTSRIDLVYRGLVLQDYHPDPFGKDTIQKARQELGLADAYPVLLNVGRLWPVKGQKDLIQAMPAVKKHFPGATLLIAGQGPLKAELEEIRDRLGLQDSVKLLGLRNDVPLLHAISDINVSASYLEGFGNASVEAMAAGKPVVAYDIPTWREVLMGEAGVLVNIRDPELLAAEIVRLAADPEKMHTMGNRGIQIVRDNFDIHINTRHLESVYERILNGAATKRRKFNFK